MLLLFSKRNYITFKEEEWFIEFKKNTYIKK